MQRSVHAVYRRFTSFLHFSLGMKKCINCNKQTQITQKVGPESIAIHDILWCSKGLTGAMWPALRPATGSSQHACYVHAMTHSEGKAWENSLLWQAANCNTLPILIFGIGLLKPCVRIREITLGDTPRNSFHKFRQQECSQHFKMCGIISR